jgi:hypothetical protein
MDIVQLEDCHFEVPTWETQIPYQRQAKAPIFKAARRL